MNLKKVGVVGSAFNPPHLGHKDILDQINHEFDEILLVPSFKHAFGKQMEPYEDRLHMASAMAEAFKNDREIEGKETTRILVSHIEKSIGEQRSGPVFTYHLLEALENSYLAMGIQAQLTFVLGPDNASFNTWQRFYRGDELRERWSLRSVSERLPVHSTEIRDLISGYSRPQNLFLARLSKFLDHQVANYIYHHNLYGARV